VVVAGSARWTSCAIAVVAATCVAACGRLGFDPRTAAGDGGDDTGDGGADAAGPPPSGHVGTVAIVETAGVGDTSFEADGTHMMFVDNKPGAAGDLVVFREGAGSTQVGIDVSGDDGATWTAFVLDPSNTSGVNALGACQDTVAHQFHVSWLDTSVADQYARLVPMYSPAGHIIGFVVAANFGFFDDFEDSPGPRDLAEIVDAQGDHRIAFAGTANTGSTGRYKLALTTVAAGLAPTAQTDWTPASVGDLAGSDDLLLPNSYVTADGPGTYLVSIASNLAAGSGAPIVVAAGFPADQKLLVWAVTARGPATYTVGSAQVLSATYGGGTGARVDASLSLATAPDGSVWIARTDNASAAAPGVHLSRVDATGVLVDDAAPQPATSASVRHALVAATASSHPVAMYVDSGELVGTLEFGGAWLPAVTIAAAPDVAGAWVLEDAWRPGGTESFGAYVDAGGSAATLFASVSWH
jgi:hypothetical protein